VYAAPVDVTICALFVCSQGEAVVGVGVGVAAATGRAVRAGAVKCPTDVSMLVTGRTK
jgi:hypothetical protein